MSKLEACNDTDISQKADNLQQKVIIVNIAKQQLSLQLIESDSDSESVQDGKPVQDSNQGQTDRQILRNFSISTAKNGIGSQEGSNCTPLGKHVIAAKIGTDLPINSVFVAREPTGEIYSEQLGQQFPERDWILSRILRLEGCEQGINKGSNELGCCDSFQRYIYIHGTPDSEPMGVPLSHGCVRMRNSDIIWLSDQVKQGTPVYIVAE